jgi:hypothetical protein
MEDAMSGERQIATTFVVRVTRDARGGVSGVVERVATGAKQRFEGFDAIGRVIAGMLGARPVGGSVDEPDPE